MGAAIYVSEAYAAFASNDFFWNAGASGGAITLVHHHAALFDNNYFHNNYAIHMADKPINIVKDQNSFRGGAVYIDCKKS